MKRLVIIGASGHGKVCANIAQRMKRWETLAFLDDNKHGHIHTFPIVGPINLTHIQPHDDVFVALGDNHLRSEISDKLIENDCSLVTLIDPSAFIGLGVQLGLGSVVMPHAVINADAHIGQGVIINSTSVIEHDCNIEDYVHISPRASLAGNCTVGQNTWIGMGSSVIQNIKIVDDVMVGAGSVVIDDIDEPGVYVGCPVRKIK